MKSHRMMTALAFLLLLVLDLSLATKAQYVVTGALEGMVTDSVTGTPIEGASVRIVNELGKIDLVIRTDKKGHFYKGLLPSGVYKIQFSASGHLSREVTQRVYVTRVSMVVPYTVTLDPVKPKRIKSRKRVA